MALKLNGDKIYTNQTNKSKGIFSLFVRLTYNKMFTESCLEMINSKSFAHNTEMNSNNL